MTELQYRKEFMKEVYREFTRYLNMFCYYKDDEADKIRIQYNYEELENIPDNKLLDDNFIKKYMELAKDVFKMNIDNWKYKIKRNESKSL